MSELGIELDLDKPVGWIIKDDEIVRVTLGGCIALSYEGGDPFPYRVKPFDDELISGWAIFDKNYPEDVPRVFKTEDEVRCKLEILIQNYCLGLRYNLYETQRNAYKALEEKERRKCSPWGPDGCG